MCGKKTASLGLVLPKAEHTFSGCRRISSDSQQRCQSLSGQKDDGDRRQNRDRRSLNVQWAGGLGFNSLRESIKRFVGGGDRREVRYCLGVSLTLVGAREHCETILHNRHVLMARVPNPFPLCSAVWTDGLLSRSLLLPLIFYSIATSAHRDPASGL